MKNCFYLIAISVLIGVGCQRDLNSVSEDYKTMVIVEGHIEQGGFPLVYLTRNIPYYVNIDSSDLIYLVLRQAYVSVSDGINSEVLTLRYDESHFPPFYYQGTALTGQIGKSYYLTIIYGQDTLHATTTIPIPVKPDSAWLQPQDDDPGKCMLFVKFHDDPLVKNYYRTFTRVFNTQSDFYPTLIANYKDKLFNGQTYTIELNKGPETYLDLSMKDFSYKPTDIVLLKFCTLDEDHFNFWESYHSELINVSNPFASSFHAVKSNIQGKGFGIWGGYGTTILQAAHQ